MHDLHLSQEPTIIVVDQRPDAERGGVGLALRAYGSVLHAPDGLHAGRLAEARDAGIAFVHAGHDAGAHRPGGGVLAAAELARHRKGISIVLVGAPSDIGGLAILHHYGATARYVPDATPREHATRLLGLLAQESAARTALADTLRSIPTAPRQRLPSTWLTAFGNDVEASLIRVTHPCGKGPGAHAEMLGLRDTALRSKLRKLTLPAYDDPMMRSSRDRILVVGSGAASAMFGDALSSGPAPLVVVAPAALEARAEVASGARAAIVEVDTLDGVAVAWALACIAPLMPLVLHGRGDARCLSLLRALGGAPEPVSTDELANAACDVAERVLGLGRASASADVCCKEARGMGHLPAAPRAIRMTEVIRDAKADLARVARQQEGTLAKAARLLRVSTRTLQRLLDRPSGLT